MSSQDSDVVARLKVASDFFSAAPTDFAPALPRDGEFLSSTFVASTNGQLPNLPPTCAVAPPAGLEVSFDNSGKVVKSSAACSASTAFCTLPTKWPRR